MAVESCRGICLITNKRAEATIYLKWPAALAFTLRQWFTDEPWMSHWVQSCPRPPTAFQLPAAPQKVNVLLDEEAEGQCGGALCWLLCGKVFLQRGSTSIKCIRLSFFCCCLKVEKPQHILLQPSECEHMSSRKAYFCFYFLFVWYHFNLNDQMWPEEF